MMADRPAEAPVVIDGALAPIDPRDAGHRKA
jgi:hypothetical protein